MHEVHEPEHELTFNAHLRALQACANFVAADNPLHRCCACYKDMIHLISRQESMFIMRKHSKDVCSAVGGCWHTFTLVCAGVGLSDFDCWHIDVQ